MASGTTEMWPGPKKRKKRNSTVGDVIKFEPKENPSWRTEAVPPIQEMLGDIMRHQEEWNSIKGNRDASANQKAFLEKFIFHCNREEDHGCGTLEGTRECLALAETVDYSKLSRKQQETVNLKEAYAYLLHVKETESDSKCHGLIEESMIKEANKIILTGTSTKPGHTKPGEFSNLPRVTEFEGETYIYQQPEDMPKTAATILDRFNSLYEDSQNAEKDSQESQNDEKERLSNLYKACSWFVFEMLDLHPFGDGNGRLCRLLCSYVLSMCTPFPTPIYNIWSESCKDDYKKALVEARKSVNRHPEALATMIIECSWHGWKKFLKNLSPTPAATNESASTDESASDMSCMSEQGSQTCNAEEDVEEDSDKKDEPGHLPS